MLLCLPVWHHPQSKGDLEDLSLEGRAWSVCSLSPLFVWASKASLRVTVFSLCFVSHRTCWAKGILLHVTMTTAWPAGYGGLYSNSRKWGYFLTQREQLPALGCMGIWPVLWDTRSCGVFVCSFIITSPYQSTAISSNSVSSRLPPSVSLPIRLLFLPSSRTSSLGTFYGDL